MNLQMVIKKTFCLSAAILFLAVGTVFANQSPPQIASPFTQAHIPQTSAVSTLNAYGTILEMGPLGNPVDTDTALVDGADYLKHAQADVTEDNAGNGDPDDPDDPDDGGWDWRLTSPNFTHSTSASPTNIYGATATGLYYAYLETSDASYITALQDAATQMIGNPNIRSAADLIFLMRFQDLSGVTPDIYKDAAKAKFDDRIATYGTATYLAEYIRDARAGQGYENGIIPWDIGAWVVAAQMLGDRYPSDPYDYAQAADDMAEVIYQDSYEQSPGYFDLTTDKNNGWDPTYSNYDYYWYTLGITGIIDAFVTADVHTDKISDLVTILSECQYSGEGAFSYCYGANPDDEDWQSTAYAVMSLQRVDQATYQTNINYACYWLGATQDASGGWVYSSGNHYPEVGGECTAALYFGENVFDEDPTEVWVDDDFNASWCDGHLWDYDAFDNIQDGIDAVAVGGTVTVYDGTYDENVQITKSLTLQAGSNPIIDGSGGICISIAASDVTINGFELIGGYQGILAWIGSPINGSGYQNVHILNNHIHNIVHTSAPWGFGIYLGTEGERYNPDDPLGIYDPLLTSLMDFTGLLISGNEIYDTSGACMTLQSLYSTSGTLDVIDNEIHDGDMSAIWIDSARDLKVESNDLYNCSYGTFISSYASGWYEGIPDGPFDSKDILFQNNDVYNNSYGIALYDGWPDYLTFTYNRFSGNTSLGFYNYLAVAANAECNWWGAIDGPSGSGPGSGDAVSENVDFEPWLLGLAPDDVCYGYEGIVACMENPRNHGQFVSCVANVARDLKKDGVITGKEVGAIVSWAAKADIP